MSISFYNLLEVKNKIEEELVPHITDTDYSTFFTHEFCFMFHLLLAWRISI